MTTDNGSSLPAIAAVTGTYDSSVLELTFPESPSAITIQLRIEFKIGSVANNDEEVVSTISGTVNVILCTYSGLNSLATTPFQGLSGSTVEVTKMVTGSKTFSFLNTMPVKDPSS